MMVRHLVLWRLHTNLRTADAAQLRTALIDLIDTMRAGIVGLHALEIGFHSGSAQDAADLALMAVFHDWDALKLYEQHPLHRALKAFIGPMRAEKRVVDYEVPSHPADG
jgi:hypothetical protein